jgi:N utilization substance protein B
VGAPIDEILSFNWYDKKISDDEKEYASLLIRGVAKEWDRYNNLIQKYSQNRSYDQISVVNRCILRVSIFSLFEERLMEPKVIIEEAIVLTKEFESEHSISFNNGILDAIWKKEILKED